MSDFSRAPLEVLQASLQKGYVGLHVEQGVPILDRDLNLQHDLLAATARSLFGRYVGDGLAAAADGFAVTALPSGQSGQDFRIAAADGGPGSFLVGGIEVTIPTAVRRQAGLSKGDLVNFAASTSVSFSPPKICKLSGFSRSSI